MLTRPQFNQFELRPDEIGAPNVFMILLVVGAVVGICALILLCVQGLIL